MNSYKSNFSGAEVDIATKIIQNSVPKNERGSMETTAALVKREFLIENGAKLYAEYKDNDTEKSIQKQIDLNDIGQVKDARIEDSVASLVDENKIIIIPIIDNIAATAEQRYGLISKDKVDEIDNKLDLSGGTLTGALITKDVTVNGYLNYTNIETAGGNVDRPVWFASDTSNGKPVVNNNFKYNPSTETLTVKNVSGKAVTAVGDKNGNDITTTYLPLTGGTLTGNLRSSKIGDTIYFGTNSKVNTTIVTTENGGWTVYSNKNTKTILSIDDAGNISLNGTAAKAISDSAGNNINDTYINKLSIGAAKGVAPLDDDKKVPLENIPAGILGFLTYGGTFYIGESIAGGRQKYTVKLTGSAKTIIENRIALGQSIDLDQTYFPLVDQEDNEYSTETAGKIIKLGSAYCYNLFFSVTKDAENESSILSSVETNDVFDSLASGDWLISNDSSWGRIKDNSGVTSINGKTGGVTLYGSDIAVSATDATKIDTKFTNYLPLSGGTLTGALAITNGYFNYSYIETAGGNADRPIWFASDGSNGKPVINTNFKYNPSTETLTVKNVSGNANTATKATQDKNGNDITTTYLPLTGGNVTGSIIVTAETGQFRAVKNGTTGNIALENNGDNGAGIYLNNYAGISDYLCYCDKNGNKIFKGNATTSTTANGLQNFGMNAITDEYDVSTHTFTNRGKTIHAFSVGGTELTLIGDSGVTMKLSPYSKGIWYSYGGDTTVMGITASGNVYHYFLNNPTTAGSFGITGGHTYSIEQVSSLPSSPDDNTIYIIPED